MGFRRSEKIKKAVWHSAIHCVYGENLPRSENRRSEMQSGRRNGRFWRPWPMAAAPVSFPNNGTARRAPSPHTVKTFTESWVFTKPINSKSALRFCVRSEKHKTEQEKSRPCQALSLTGAASSQTFAFNPARTFSESSGSMPHHPARQTIVPILLRLRAARVQVQRR